MDHDQTSQLILSILNDEGARKTYFSSPEIFFFLNKITSEETKKTILDLLPAPNSIKELQKANAEQALGFINVNNAYRRGISETITQTIDGFRSTMLMYKVSFYLGVVMLLAALVFAFMQRSSLYAVLFGSIGTLDLLTFFIAKPPQSLQQSRSEQTKLNAAFYSWFINLTNWNGYFLKIQEQGVTIDFQKINEASTAQIDCTIKMMTLIGEHINDKV